MGYTPQMSALYFKNDIVAYRIFSEWFWKDQHVKPRQIQNNETTELAV